MEIRAGLEFRRRWSPFESQRRWRHFLYRIALGTLVIMRRRASPFPSHPLPPTLSLSLRSRLLSVQEYTPMPMTNAFPYPVASILDANGPFHAGPRRYLMYLAPRMHAGKTLWLAALSPLHFDSLFPLSSVENAQMQTPGVYDGGDVRVRGWLCSRVRGRKFDRSTDERIPKIGNFLTLYRHGSAIGSTTTRSAIFVCARFSFQSARSPLWHNFWIFFDITSCKGTIELSTISTVATSWKESCILGFILKREIFDTVFERRFYTIKILFR